MKKGLDKSKVRPYNKTHQRSSGNHIRRFGGKFLFLILNKKKKTGIDYLISLKGKKHIFTGYVKKRGDAE